MVQPKYWRILLWALILGKLKDTKSGYKLPPPPYPIEMSTHNLPNSTKNNHNKSNNVPNGSNHGPLQGGEHYTAERITSIPPGQQFGNKSIKKK